MRPVVAGRIARQSDGKQMFNYGQSYLARKNAIAIYDSELPLRAGEIPLHDKLQLPSCIRDASPDAWGRRVIINRTLGLKGRDAGTAEPDEPRSQAVRQRLSATTDTQPAPEQQPLVRAPKHSSTRHPRPRNSLPQNQKGKFSLCGKGTWDNK